MLTDTPACLADLQRFYAALDVLVQRTGGQRRLRDWNRQDLSSLSGVYFFFEDGEGRTGTGNGQRVVRVGTHGLKSGSRSTLWSRLRQHRGSEQGGNQRGSIFRRHVGAALMQAGRHVSIDEWWVGQNAPPIQKALERPLEAMVSQVISDMTVIALPLNDDPGPESGRGYVERNAIALLSSLPARMLDPPSAGWLGHSARAQEIRASGLWNVRHVGDPVDDAFLGRFESLVAGAT